jgi:hypothetical protein
MSVIFASGALAKFLNARNRGASRQELLELKLAAMPGPPANAVPKREKAADDEPRAALVRQWDQVD